MIMTKKAQQSEHGGEDLDELRRQLEHFQKEKERVRAIVGRIGGMPKTRARLLNLAFVVVIVASLAVSAIGGDKWRLVTIEIATVALALKIIYLIHSQTRIAHFEFWILSSLEWRVNEITKHLHEMKKDRQMPAQEIRAIAREDRDGRSHGISPVAEQQSR